MSSNKQFHHAAVCVDDIGIATQWYAANLGAETLYQDKTWALMTISDFKLALVLPDQHPPHIAFECADAEKFGTLTAHRDGTASVYITDPYGNSIEFLKKSPAKKP